jgi:hypothetical protein
LIGADGAAAYRVAIGTLQQFGRIIVVIHPVGLALCPSLLRSQRRAHSNAPAADGPRIGRHSPRQHRFRPVKHSRTPPAKIRHVAGTAVGVGTRCSNGTRRATKEWRLIGSNVRSCCNSSTCDANQPVCQHFAFAFHGDQSSFFRHVTADFFQRLSTLATDVNPQGLAVRFHPRSRVDRVAKQTISGHRQTHYSGHHGSCVIIPTKMVFGVYPLFVFIFKLVYCTCVNSDPE